MKGRIDWRWVAEWALKIAGTAFLLLTFAYLSASPIIRPGGAIATLPEALLFGLMAAVPVGLIAGGVLAAVSARRRGRG